MICEFCGADNADGHSVATKLGRAAALCKPCQIYSTVCYSAARPTGQLRPRRAGGQKTRWVRCFSLSIKQKRPARQRSPFPNTFLEVRTNV